ncbi:hypothetical protein D0C36_18465 [Mucilaginibacter conchicola]|uniref:Uncharacterized protein n=1 Tax=Mucilaginibacter conchicola TaxID=2303333 RepID=A0A372NQJ8_9SPHI|nr:hypothetical protein [Mucilaginibacter conchicola]RFZ90930.1 hypothetical protein D0C36_18465 [Mucilaginibacter conchicola]
MKTNNIKIIKALLFAAILSGSCGCMDGAKKPERNKMPELSSLQEYHDGGFLAAQKLSTGPAGLNFASTQIELETNDGLKRFIRVPLPDASADSVLVKMIQTLKPLAIPLLSNWANQYNSGLLIDLSSNRSGLATYQTNYELRQQGGFVIPVILRWDRLSAYRAGTAQDLVGGTPFISLQKLSGQDPRNFKGY